MVRVGGTTSKYYKEKKGVKVSGGQVVKAGTVLTREGHKWQPGINVNGYSHLTAACDGEVYFTRKKNSFRKLITIINIRSEKEAPVKKAKKAVKKEASSKS